MRQNNNTVKQKAIKLILTIFIFISYSHDGQGQQLERQVVASGGGSGTSSAFTIGEVIVSSSTIQVITGFQQPSFMSDRTTTGITDISNTINVFPVPTQDVLNIAGADLNGLYVELSLYSANGTKVEVIAERTQNEMRLNLSTLPHGFYYLNLFDKSTNSIGKFKILKLK
jgi:hypothetical protein